MAFGVLMGQIAVIFLEVMLGYAGARCGVITDRDSRFLSDFIMKLLLPCTMLAGAAIDDEPEIVLQAGVLFVLLLALFIATTGICRLVSRVRRDTPGEAAVLVGTAAMPNCGFIGLPLCAALLGSARGTVFATVAMAAYNVWFFTYVVTLFRPGEKLHWKTFVTPANIATVAMLVLLATGWRLPGVVFPLLFLLVLRLLPLDNVLRTGLMVIASCPAGSLAAVVAKQSGTEPALASQAVAHSTICMLVTVPVMLLLTGQLFPL